MAALAPSAAAGLSAALHKASAELDWVANRLEEEFSRRSAKGEVNTLALLQRLNKLRRELPLVEAECQRVLAVRQELVDAVKTGLGANTQELWKLRRRAGIPTDAASEETHAAFTAAVAEHEKQLQAQLAGRYDEQFDREELNAAYVKSALA